MNLNRRDFVQLTAATALAGASAGATSAAGLTLNVAVPAATVAPVAYVWMGQVLLDYLRDPAGVCAAGELLRLRG